MWGRRGLSWQASLCLRLSVRRLFCLCCNPSHRHRWGRMKDFSPDPNSKERQRDKTIAKIIEKPLIQFFFPPSYRREGMLPAEGTRKSRHGENSHFICRPKTFISIRTPNTPTAGHYYGLLMTPTQCDHCFLSLIIALLPTFPVSKSRF